MVAFSQGKTDWVDNVIEQIINPPKHKPKDIFAQPELVIVLSSRDKKSVHQMRSSKWEQEADPTSVSAGIVGYLNETTVLTSNRIRKSVLAVLVGGDVLTTMPCSIKELFNRQLL